MRRPIQNISEVIYDAYAEHIGNRHARMIGTGIKNINVLSKRYSGKGRPRRTDYDCVDMFDSQTYINNLLKRIK